MSCRYGAAIHSSHCYAPSYTRKAHAAKPYCSTILSNRTVFVHSVHDEVIEFLIMLVVRDNCKSSWTDPDPEVFLVIISGIEWPDVPPAHRLKGEVRINFITAICVQVTEVMGQLRRVGPWIGPVRLFVQVYVRDNIPTFTIDPHPVFVE